MILAKFTQVFILIVSRFLYYVKYCKIPISPGLIFVQNAFCWAYFGGSFFFVRGLLLEGVLCFNMGWA